MIEILGLAAAGVAAGLGHLKSRSFVRDRLRYTDWVDRPYLGWAAGVGAAVLAAPVAWLLPLVGGGTALVFGIGVGTGAAVGARQARRIGSGRA